MNKIIIFALLIFVMISAYAGGNSCELTPVITGSTDVPDLGIIISQGNDVQPVTANPQTGEASFQTSDGNTETISADDIANLRDATQGTDELVSIPEGDDTIEVAGAYGGSWWKTCIPNCKRPKATDDETTDEAVVI